jgi:transcriptional regulator with XRE-family HTH domain
VAKKDERDFVRRFGKNLMRLRLENGLTQEDLANDADIPINQVGRIERGQINTSIGTVFKLSKALELEITELFKC